MAFHAAHATVDVDGVIEINVVRNAVDLNPGNGLSACGAFANEGQSRVVFKDLVVAIHAGAAARYVAIPRLFDAVVAIPAVHPELPCVGCVGESDRLNRLIPDARILRRQVIPYAGNEGASDQEATRDDQDRQSIGPLRENR
jgi:hypothetical protein